MGDFKRKFGKKWTIAYITLWVIDLNENAQVKTKMNDAQIEFVADRIYSSYSLKVTDLTLFFRNIKEGVYGQFYENLSSEKIMEWLAQYYELRCEFGQMQSMGRHDNFSMTKDPINPDVAKKMFEGVGEDEVVYKEHKNGLGTRHKNALLVSITLKSTEELKSYLVKNDHNSPNYDKDIYLMVEKELDYRNSNNKSA